jgi:5-methylcytosine-specific restriction protein A
MPTEFQVGQIYNRRRDIHAVCGGQRQGGIATPAKAASIFLFTGEAGEQHGYSDGWDSSGVFLYTDEGQIGSMQFVRGNRAIRDHAIDGKDLLLFEATKKRGEYRYRGQFVCANWEMRNGPDTMGDIREAIIFHLIPASGLEQQEPQLPLSTGKLSLGEIKKLAYAAAATHLGRSGKDAKRSFYERCAAVREYVLARAAGVCECCKTAAPFHRKDGSPYLEPHHIRRMSDGGPDHPRWVGAICPTCHREIHYGAEGQRRNAALSEYLAQKERQ